MTGSDTIAAIATGMSASGIGIVRISGEEAFSIADQVFQPKKEGKKLSEQDTYTIHYGNIVDDNEILDEVIVLLMKGPHSYTAEDTVEIDCHGGAYVMQRILQLILQKGARAAEPGEFTKRAFLNGRIDLSQAEAVMDLIHAKNEYAFRSSVQQLKGSVLKKIQELRGQIIHEIARIEASLDDPEHMSLEGYPQFLNKKVDNLLKEADEMLINAGQGRILKEGIQTAIVGKPNVGKSTLLNVLLGADRAIVTEVPGTTRDLLEEQILLRGLNLNLIDTAGIHRTDDFVEKIGIDKAKETLDGADLILYVADSSKPLDQDDEELFLLLKNKNVIILLNKTDLPKVTTSEMILAHLQAPVLYISAKEETGIEEFAELIEKMFLSGKISYNDQVYLTNARHQAAMKSARDSLKKVQESIFCGMPEDFYSIDLMDAYHSLGSILGESVEEDLIDEIFGSFCMGK